LSGLLYELDSQGRLKIESKEKARARGVPSPDRAEALMLALCKPPQRYEYYSIRDLRQMQSQSSTPQYHDDDDYCSPRSRRYDVLVSGSVARSLRRNPGAW